MLVEDAPRVYPRNHTNFIHTCMTDVGIKPSSMEVCSSRAIYQATVPPKSTDRQSRAQNLPVSLKYQNTF